MVEESAFTREEEIYVQCFRDPATKNSKDEVLGGIADPNIHDAILRDVARDSLQIPYLYKHEMDGGSSETLWRLVFRRYLQGTVGVSA
jgi:hypothetical protein